GSIDPSVGPVETLVSEPGRAWEYLSLSFDGKWLAAAGRGESTLIDLRDPSHRVQFGLGEKLTRVSISRDHRWLAGGAYMGSGVTIWDAQTGARVGQLVTNQNAQVAFSPDGLTLATTSEKEYCLWSTASWKLRKRVTIGTAIISGGPIAFSRDGKLLGLAPDLRQILLVNAQTGEELATLTAPDTLHHPCLAFSADGGYLAAGTSDHLVHLWDLHALRRQLAEMNLDWSE